MSPGAHGRMSIVQRRDLRPAERPDGDSGLTLIRNVSSLL